MRLSAIPLILIPTIFLGQNYCQPQSHEYDVINDFDHNVGQAWSWGEYTSAWAVNSNDDDSGYLSFGPYDSSFPPGENIVYFNLLIDNNTAVNNIVLIIDVYDATQQQQLVQIPIYRHDFIYSWEAQVFSLQYNHIVGNVMEYRVYWTDQSACALLSLSVETVVTDSDEDGVCDGDTYSECLFVDIDEIFGTSVSYGGSNYYLSNSNYNWELANELAYSLGGHLVTINSIDENAFLQILSANSPWIGLFQNQNSSDYSEPSGGWEWVNGECLDYQNWSEGEPNNASEMENGEAHAHITPYGTWNDWLADTSAPFIMEINCIEAVELCIVFGCTYPSATNYDSIATNDDGSCLFDDCDINAAYEEGYDAGVASVECPEESCLGDLNLDGGVSTADLLIFLGAFGLECEDDSTFICGNGVVEPGEECDDGNNVPDDGCDGCLIVNTPPIVSQVVITPNAPVEGNTLVCTYTFQDVDNDIDQSTISWTVDGQSVGAGSTLTYPFTTGAVITCLVTPFDGIDTGQEVSATVVVQ